MPKPIILAIDDDTSVLEAVVQDLRRHYGQEYRIVRAASGQAALDICRQLIERQETVALFLSDQRMPGMSGVEFLQEAMQLYPEAKRVLLTAYADTEAAIRAINSAIAHPAEVVSLFRAQPVHPLCKELRSQSVCLQIGTLGQLVPAEPLRESQIVLDPGARPGLSADRLRLNDQGPQPLRRTVHARCQPGRSGANDDDVVKLFAGLGA